MKLVAVVGPTASGKSALALAVAEACAGEIISCDSTAVYRGLDIGTDKPSGEDRARVPHHLLDLVGPGEVYSAARYAREAADAARGIVERGHLPIVVGGTGFYFRALVRGIFDGPSRDPDLRARLSRVAKRRGVLTLYRWLSKVDPPSGRRVQPRDEKRIVRALEVYLLTGRPLTDHFVDTVSAIPEFDVRTIGVRLPRADLGPRVAARVDAQFRRGVVDEVRGLLAAGIPPSAHAFSGLVYRQVMDLLAGIRGEAETRALIVQENMRYARRQLIWFRKETDVTWIDGPGEAAPAIGAATDLVRTFLARG